MYPYNTVVGKATCHAYLREFVLKYPEIAGQRLAEYLRNHLKEKSHDDMFFTIIRVDPIVAFEFATEGYCDVPKGGAQLKAINAMVNNGDIDEAIARTERIPSFKTRMNAIWSTVQKMSVDDLLENPEWIEPMLLEEKEGIIRGLGDRLPSFKELEDWPLREYLEELVRPKLVNELAAGLYELRSVEEIEAKFNHFEELGINDGDRALIEERWAHGVGRQHPEDAPWVVGMMRHHAETLVAASIGSVVEESPQEAFELASRLPAEYHSLAAGRIIGIWYGRDSVAASSYVTQMDAGPLRYEAAKGLAQRLEWEGNTEDAAHWKQWAEQHAGRQSD